MRNSRALAGAATVVAVLGLATPAAVADGMGGAGGQSNNNDSGNVVVVPGTNGIGSGTGIVPGTGIGPGGIGPGGIGPGGVGPGNNNGFGQGNNHGGGPGNNGFGQGNNNGGGPGNNGFGQGNNNGFGPGNNGFGQGNNNGFGPGNNGFGPGNDNGFGPDNDHGGISRNIVATPSVIAAGGQLTVTVDGCRNGGTVTSPAFRRTSLSRVPGTNDTSSGRATVDRDARPGSYDITVNCVGSGSLTRPNAFTVIGGVRGGFGGSRSTGATPTDMAIGGGLVALAFIGGGVFWMRRRSEKRI